MSSLWTQPINGWSTMRSPACRPKEMGKFLLGFHGRLPNDLLSYAGSPLLMLTTKELNSCPRASLGCSAYELFVSKACDCPRRVATRD